MKSLNSRVTEREKSIMNNLIGQANLYSNLDIRTRSRERDFAYARKAYMWVANKVYRVKVKHIGDEVNTCHATVIYHIRTAQDWIDRNDKEFISLVNNSFDLDIKPGVSLDTFKRQRTVDAEMTKLKESVGSLEPFLDLLNEIPEGREQDVRDRLQLFLKTLKMTNGGDKAKLYEGHSAFLQE